MATPPKRFTIALAGNPNSGKTTIFNQLTGAKQHVGNYPGVTVETKAGTCRHNDVEFRVIDLPGAYSLTAYSPEELVARNFIIHEKPDAVVDIVDTSNLERNLYLTIQLLELETPVVVALNMFDEAQWQGRAVNVPLLSKLLGVPLVPTVGTRGEGIDELLETVQRVAETHQRPQVQPNLGRELEEHLRELAALVTEAGLDKNVPARWIALKLLEADAEVNAFVEAHAPAGSHLLTEADRIRTHLERIVGDDAEIAIADRRYGFAAGACHEATRVTQTQRLDWTAAVDRIVLSRLLGIPIFVIFMWFLFEMVFRLGAGPTRWIEALFSWIGQEVTAALPPGELRSLLVDGVVAGVGGVVVFLPNIMLLFFGIALLEDSGYMARAAFVVDRIMHRVGLHGKSFIPMLIGFGCNVPAFMGTRTLESGRDRLVTILVIPFMSCGARLPVYLVIAGAFFAPATAGHIIFGLYALGIALAFSAALLFRKVLLKGPSTPFVMELPPYRVPTVRGMLIHMWERAKLFLQKAGTVILAVSIVVWFLLTHPNPPGRVSILPAEQRTNAGLASSYAGRLGRFLEPALKPFGANWKIGIGLVTGVAAKEVVVSTLGTVYSLGETDGNTRELRVALQHDPGLGPLNAFAVMVFVLVYVPCVASLAVIFRETQSWKWTLFVMLYTTTLAWILATLVYQGGRFLGLG